MGDLRRKRWPLQFGLRGTSLLFDNLQVFPPGDLQVAYLLIERKFMLRKAN